MNRRYSRDRIGEQEITVPANRFSPIPEPYMLHIREEFDDRGNFVKTIHRKRVYEDRIVDETI